MKRWLGTGVVLAFSVSLFAQSGKPCEELKSEISKKLEAKGVTTFSLEIMPKDQQSEGKVVGTCEGGTKKIVYSRTPTASQKPAEPEKKS